MNGGHDLGGMHGFGPVTPEPDEPVFHHEWERRAFALALACGMLGRWNLDMSRHARERIPPPRYLGASYYEIWLEGLLTLLVEQGLASEREIETGRSAGPRSLDLRVPGPDAVPGILERGGSTRVADTPASLSGRGPGTGSEPSPARTHPGASLRSRAHRCHRKLQRHLRLPRRPRPREGAAAAAALHGALQRDRALGKGRRLQ